MNAHADSMAKSGERIVSCPPGGMLGLGDEVTFEAVHLGVRQRLTSRIVEFDRPRRFVDEMVRGAFASFRHVHEFTDEGGSVLVRETATWRSPLGILGAIADALVVERHLRTFLETKLSGLKAVAEQAAGRARSG